VVQVVPKRSDLSPVGTDAAARRPLLARLADEKWVDLSRLKVIGLVVPLLFLLGVEALRFLVVEDDMRELPGHVGLFLATLVGVGCFSLAMFLLIDRAQRRVVLQNRELAAANAVATAIRGAGSVQETIDAALEAVVTSTGAEEAVVVITPQGRRGADHGGLARRLTADGDFEDAPPDLGYDASATTVPLSTGTTTVGLMRIRWEKPHGSVPLSFDTLQTIGQQIAQSVQTAGFIADLREGRVRGHSFFDILLKVSSQADVVDILADAAAHLREHLDADAAGITINPTTSHLFAGDDTLAGLEPHADGSRTITSGVHAADGLTIHSCADAAASVAVTVRGSWGAIGEVWAGRHDPEPFEEGDRRFAETMAELVSIAVGNARMRQHEEETAVVAERERLAREMHDGMAQVLGATHLRLRALEGREELRDSGVGAEISDLADLCHEAYGDVRENILGLRESSKPERALLDSLQAYVDSFGRRAGIAATLVCSLDHPLVLPPRCELQVLRVVQEALTNVRKHSGASSVVVRVSEGLAGTEFVIEDDGKGFDLSSLSPGRENFGLHSMRQRMDLVNGTLTVDSALGKGTAIVATVPVVSLSASSEVSRARS
jgi:two-component system nitrate/nitrite sensor histidine kinase NarX